MSEKNLAIATVPVQEWGDLYLDREALKKGTIFKALDKPFFAAEEMTEGAEQEAAEGEKLDPRQTEQEEMLGKIQELSFVLDDLTLYLDTHEQDTAALQMFLKKTGERKELLQKFAEICGPLTRDCCSEDKETEYFGWQRLPMPWEGGCTLCGIMKKDSSFL
ncbi:MULTISPECIES: spore coat protein CotJB [Lachnospiraceae]|uniref:Spore coat protein CotJB n=1 Tax=Faecalicatena acetigenes TaxID=2981790 RepID=A0ABT2TD10_9FIRM|nr:MULTISPECIES: spore coat protein CotJB [Lachnospiraceae]MCU6748127.1 spore coat protein CotJB [Faecalicatena acetigenes]SCI27335.1 CotJB protein [uncultured Clostridium sp.]